MDFLKIQLCPRHIVNINRTLFRKINPVSLDSRCMTSCSLWIWVVYVYIHMVSKTLYIIFSIRLFLPIHWFHIHFILVQNLCDKVCIFFNTPVDVSIRNPEMRSHFQLAVAFCHRLGEHLFKCAEPQ